MSVSRARCLLQAGNKPIAVSAIKKDAVSPKSKPSNGSLGFLSMGRGTLPHGGKLSVLRWNRRLPQGSLLLLAACLCSSAACWMHSPVSAVFQPCFWALSTRLLLTYVFCFILWFLNLCYLLMCLFSENRVCMFFIALRTNLKFYNGYRIEQLLTVDVAVCSASYNNFFFSF